MTTPSGDPSRGRGRRSGRPAATAVIPPRSAARPAAGGESHAAPRPPLWRDPWAWACGLAVLPILIHSWGARLGEPVADDYVFLHRALLDPLHSWFDGGGAMVYWRPLSRQLYYGLLGPLMLDHPRALALVHAALLALAAVLIYRALRPRWSASAAALAATFPLFAEGTRTLVLWPAAFQDLGAMLFSALALHEAAHRRRATALAALLAGLLCKEIAVVTAMMLPWMPDRERRGLAFRPRFALATAAVVAAWGAAYLVIRQSAGVLFQRQFEEGRMPLPQRLLWAFGHAVTDAFNLDLRAPLAALAIVAAMAVLVAVALRRRSASGPQASRAWIAWGLAWFALSSATLSETFPQWGPFRSAVGLVGLGIALAVALQRLGAAGAALLTAVRLTTFFLAPGPPTGVAQAPPAEGVGLDFDSLARLQRYAADVRALITTRYPTLPHGSAIGRHHRPLMAEHAFAFGRAVQVWYRDTTLRWVEWKEIVADPDRPLATVLEYEPFAPRQVSLVDGPAMHQYLQAIRTMEGAGFAQALVHLDRADSLQQDRGARVFLGSVAGKRAICRMGLMDLAAGRREAERALALWPDNGDARYTLAVLLAGEGKLEGALAQLDTVLAKFPFDESATILRDSLRKEAPGQSGR